MERAIQPKKVTGTTCLIPQGGIGRNIACGATKAVVTSAVVTGGFFGGDALKSMIMERTENALIGEVAKYGTVLISAVLANIINSRIDKAFKYTATTIEEIKGAALLELQGMTTMMQPPVVAQPVVASA